MSTKCVNRPVKRRGGGTFRCALGIRKQLDSPRRFKGVVVRHRRSKTVLHLGSVTEVSLKSTSCDIISQLGKRPATTVTVCRRPNSGSLSISGKIGTGVRRLTTGFPTKISCGIALSAASIVRTSVSRIVIAFFRAALLIVLIVFLFLRG